MTDTPDPTAAEPASDQPAPAAPAPVEPALAQPGPSLPEPAPAPAGDDAGATGWQQLPSRAVLLCTIDVSVSLAVVFAIAGVMLGMLTIGAWVAVASGLSGALLGAGIGTWIGLRRYRNTLWRLDPHGFAVRRGVAWQRETLVPLTRVQHLDLKHGPLQRLRGLATLVVHTAGTRHNAVSIDHLDADDAERLRERLGRQLDHDEDA
jgi:membrane protein YdbS with pleckstrin-like domain